MSGSILTGDFGQLYPGDDRTLKKAKFFIIVASLFCLSDLLPKNLVQRKSSESCKIEKRKDQVRQMKKGNYTEEQIAFALQQAEHGMPVAEVCRKLGVTEQSFYRWKKKYGGMLPSDMKKLKQLEEENAKLKKLVADLSLDKAMLQDVLSKNW